MLAGCTTRAKASRLGQSRVIQTIRPVTPPQPQTLRRSSQDNVELMTQKEVLNFKPAPRLEQIGDKCSNQMIANIALDDGLILPHSANPTGSNFRERQGG